MLNKNTNLIIGKINSGKTRGILLKEAKRAIQNEENLLFLDNKKEYYGTYAKELKEKGYNVLVFNLDDATKTNGWNPLSLPYYFYKKGQIDLTVELVNSLGLDIFKADGQSMDPFWENTSAEYFTGLVLTLFKEAKEEEVNFGSIGTMISLGDKKIGDTTVIKKYVESLDPLNAIYVSMSPTAFAPNDTKASIMSVVKQKLNIFLMRENLLNALNTNDIDLANIKGKTAIFIIGKPELNSLANVLISQVKYLPNYASFNFILDNFDTLPVFKSLQIFVENASFNGSKINVAVKNKEEMEEKYGKYVIDRFENVLEVKEEKDLVEVGNYDVCPELKMNKHSYFNIEEFVKNIK